MLFNSLSFAFFFPLVFGFYWFLAGNRKSWQNLILLVSSYYFYSCWDWRFLFLLIFSTLLDYYTGLKIADSASQVKRKFWLILSIGINLGFLAVFKYFNFFSESFSGLLSNMGFMVNPWSIQVILPVGISFYTFHGLSYVIDIYFRRIPVERNFTDYSVFVCFFPLLVAGPIERASHLLPQIKKSRVFDYEKAVNGLRQILWGLFKKIVIADNCAEQANIIFNSYEEQSGSVLFLGAFFFAFQIYGDFSGYSDIALGSARLLGIELLQNFSFPYFSRDISEFWRRWHISLSSWFRDYLYIPLGGSKVGTLKKIRNTFIIFLVSGFWHGANWTFIAWGFLNAVFILPSVLLSTNRKHMEVVAKGKIIPSAIEFFQILFTFFLTTLAWVFFRSDSLSSAFGYLSIAFSKTALQVPVLKSNGWIALSLSLCFFIIEWFGREGRFALEHLGLTWKSPFRYGFYFLLLILMFIFTGKEQEFIYFQF